MLGGYLGRLVLYGTRAGYAERVSAFELGWTRRCSSTSRALFKQRRSSPFAMAEHANCNRRRLHTSSDGVTSGQKLRLRFVDSSHPNNPRRFNVLVDTLGWDTVARLRVAGGVALPDRRQEEPPESELSAAKRSAKVTAIAALLHRHRPSVPERC
jgi:hypothetical protein